MVAEEAQLGGACNQLNVELIPLSLSCLCGREKITKMQFKSVK